MGEVLRKMFSLAITWGWRTDNPAAGFKKRVETARERFMSHEEIGRLAEVLDAALDQRAAGIIRICMLTGSRVGEVRQAQFEQFNLELGVWSKPAATTKQRKVHRIPPDGGSLPLGHVLEVGVQAEPDVFARFHHEESARNALSEVQGAVAFAELHGGIMHRHDRTRKVGDCAEK